MWNIQNTLEQNELNETHCSVVFTSAIFFLNEQKQSIAMCVTLIIMLCVDQVD